MKNQKRHFTQRQVMRRNRQIYISFKGPARIKFSKQLPVLRYHPKNDNMYTRQTALSIFASLHSGIHPKNSKQIDKSLPISFRNY